MSGTTSRRLSGVVSFTVNGAPWDSVDNIQYRPSMTERSTVKGQSRVEGYSEMPMEGFIKGALRDRGDATVQSLNDLTGASVVVIAANGKAVIGGGMWQVGEITVGTKEGTFDIQFDSDYVVEQPV